MFTYYLVTGIITVALLALCAFLFLDKTKVQGLLNNLQKHFDSVKDTLDKTESDLKITKQDLKDAKRVKTEYDEYKKKQNLAYTQLEQERDWEVLNKQQEIDELSARIEKLNKEHQKRIAKLNKEIESLKASAKETAKEEVKQETTEVVVAETCFEVPVVNKEVAVAPKRKYNRKKQQKKQD